ncbi:FecR family protein [Treponema socranskii]|uniref:FecR family protein n=1 Tax=Treponema socranskii TaxID=53419 RepID=UPI003D927A4A
MNCVTMIKKSICVAFAALCIALPLCAASATVVSAEGKVEVERGGTWVPLSANDTVSEGETVSTGFKSKALLRYQGSVLQVGALTRITLEKLAEGEKNDTVAVYLNTGAIKSTVQKTENRRVNYTVRNPVAVASVRGTEFDFAGDGAISCADGAVVTYSARLFDASAASEAPSEGESNAATPATDIAPAAPAGAVVVLQGQAVAFSSDGMSSSPAQSAAAAASQVAATVSTPVETESVSTGAAGSAGAAAASEVIAKNTGTIKVRVAFDD